MIFDICFYNNEIDLLTIRLNQHDKYVDKFIIIYGDRTFSGKKKFFNEKKFFLNFKKFKKKIILRKVILSEKPKSRWDNEIKTVNFVNNLNFSFNLNDIIIVSDVDEIIKDTAFLEIKKIKNFPQTIQVENFYYYFNGKIISGYANDFGPIVLKKENLDTTIFDHRKNRANLPKINNGGWHFSYIGGPSKISQKIKDFSHSEFDNKKFNNINKIKKLINEGKDLFLRKAKHEHFKGDEREFRVFYQKISDDYPKYFIQNLKKYKKFVKSSIFIKHSYFLDYIKDNEQYIYNIRNMLENEKKKTNYLYSELQDKNQKLNEIYNTLFYKIYLKFKNLFK